MYNSETFEQLKEGTFRINNKQHRPCPTGTAFCLCWSERSSAQLTHATEYILKIHDNFVYAYLKGIEVLYILHYLAALSNK